MTTHLFNPENDLALAANLDLYTPPSAAVALSRSGALIPAWLAKNGDSVIVYSETDFEAAEELCRRFGIDILAVTTSPHEGTGFSPWGWSRHARQRFISLGADPALLPADSWLERHRHLSSRLTTVDLCHHLNIQPPVVAKTVEEAAEAIDRNRFKGRGSYLKMPWSSSGRGVFPTAGMSPALIAKRTADIIRTQGFILVEPDRCRKADFAALYHLSGGTARFHALSIFSTDDRGAYRGNLIISDNEIIAKLGADPMPWVEKMSGALTAVVAPEYSGWAGVDMVVTEMGDIYPCIELNLRTTMGVVAAAMRPYFNRPMLLAPSPANQHSHLPIEIDR